MTAIDINTPLPRGKVETTRGVSNPRPEIYAGAAVAGLFFCGFIGWASMAPLDAAAHAAGQVVVSGHRQVVQHPEGGVVSALLVREGDHVVAGQPLIELNSAEYRAAERSLASRVIQRQAELARLRAELTGGPLERPEAFASYTQTDKVLADDAMLMAARELSARRDVYRGGQAALRSRIDQLAQQIGGARGQIDSSARQRELLQDELSGMRQLAAKGYAPQTRVRALERQVAELEGATGGQHAELGRLSSSTQEVRTQIARGAAEQRQTLAEEQRAAETDLAATLPQWVAAKQRLESSQIRATTTGTVMSISVNNVGGVIGAGQRLLEIVPSNPSLTMEVRVSQRDVEGMRANTPVDVRFPSLANRKTPIHGTMTRIAPDSVTDEQTGQVYYPAAVTAPPAEMRKLEHDGQSVVVAGMPVEVLVTKRKRTLLQFLFEPLTATLWRQGA